MPDDDFDIYGDDDYDAPTMHQVVSKIYSAVLDPCLISRP